MRHESLTDAQIVEQAILTDVLAQEQARRSFWAFRQYTNPRLKRGWWQRRVAHELQRFAEDLMSGTAPMLAIDAPPQHGKSMMVIDLIAWIVGKRPDLQTIYASFSDRLGVRANLRLQRTFSSSRYRALFPDLQISERASTGIASRWQRNKEMLEFVGREGYFRNTTVLGSVTGEGLGLGVVDDPIKGRAEAKSPTQRQKVWDWFTDDFFTRFSEEAGLLFIMTRWHLDDPRGRMEEAFPEMRTLSYPAIAVGDERDEGGALLRHEGEVLFPELKSLEFVERRRLAMLPENFEALYQGNPQAGGGTIFPVDRIETIDFPPKPSQVVASVRYWDKAGTRGAGAYSAGVLMHKLIDDRFCVSHVCRDRVGYAERERKIKELAQRDVSVWGAQTEVYVEQEPGSGGKESAQRTVANLAGFLAYADRPTGDKELRAEPFAVQVQAENVCVVAGTWNQKYLDELEDFPSGKYKDQVDASSGAFAKLTGDESRGGVLF